MTDGPETIFDGARLRALLFAQDAADAPLIVTFDFRKTGRDGFSAATHSTQFHRRGYAQLSIKAARNDWFINDETAALEAALAKLRRRYARRQGLGYSMGGYGVFRFAAALGLQQAVAVSPQFSLAPEVVPWEWRYKEEAAGFDPALGALPPAPGLKALIVTDPFVRADLRHAEMLMSAFAGTRLARLNFGGHPAIGLLREAGKGWVITREASSTGLQPRRVLAAHRAARRASHAYWTRLADAAHPRHPALCASALARAEALEPAPSAHAR